MSRRTLIEPLLCCFVFLLLLPTCLDAAQPAVAPLTMQFGAQSVSVSPVTNGGKVVLFGIAREMTASRPPVQLRVRHAEVLIDDDHDGLVRLDLGKPLPAVAIWMAVDMTTGAYVALPSPGYELTRAALTSDQLKNDNNGQLKKLEWKVPEMELFLVRPGVGAWRLYAAKSSKLDENAANTGPLRIDFDSLLPIGDSARAPTAFKKGDVIGLIDPRWMQYGMLEVGQ